MKIIVAFPVVKKLPEDRKGKNSINIIKNVGKREGLVKII